MREVLDWESKWNKMATLAINMYTSRIIKYIWSYIATMWWLDILVFTAWVWENSPIIREKIIKKLSYFGIKLNKIKNKQAIWIEWIISDKNSKIKVIVVPTKEEFMIAIETFNIIKK